MKHEISHTEKKLLLFFSPPLAPIILKLQRKWKQKKNFHEISCNIMKITQVSNKFYVTIQLKCPRLTMSEMNKNLKTL